MIKSSNSIQSMQLILTKFLIKNIGKKKFELFHDNDAIIILNSPRRTIFAFVASFGLSLLALSWIEPFLMHNDNFSTGMVVVQLIILPLIGLHFLRQLIWLLNGEHQLKLTAEYIVICNKGTYISREKKFSLNSLVNVEIHHREQTNMTVRDQVLANMNVAVRSLFAQTLGVIVLKFEQKSVVVLSDLSHAESIKVMHQLNNFILNHKN
jgi:hypothetical protein